MKHLNLNEPDIYDKALHQFILYKEGIAIIIFVLILIILWMKFLVNQLNKHI